MEVGKQLTSHFNFFLDLCAWVFCWHVCLCSTCMPDVCRGQKRVSDSPELEVQNVMSQHVRLGTGSSARTTSALNQRRKCLKSWNWWNPTGLTCKLVHWIVLNVNWPPPGVTASIWLACGHISRELSWLLIDVGRSNPLWVAPFPRPRTPRNPKNRKI